MRTCPVQSRGGWAKLGWDLWHVLRALAQNIDGALPKALAWPTARVHRARLRPSSSVDFFG
eukprot:9005431-Alexandrium_andersonii.AAC.1